MTKTTKLPFIRLWIDDFTITTKHMSTFDIGAYVNLVVAAWRAGGSLPDDDELLARIVGAYSGRSKSRWQEAKPRIMALWTLKDGKWTCPWIEDEWEYATTRKSANHELPSPPPQENEAAPAPAPTHAPDTPTEDKPTEDNAEEDFRKLAAMTETKEPPTQDACPESPDDVVRARRRNEMMEWAREREEAMSKPKASQ